MEPKRYIYAYATSMERAIGMLQDWLMCRQIKLCQNPRIETARHGSRVFGYNITLQQI